MGRRSAKRNSVSYSRMILIVGIRVKTTSGLFEFALLNLHVQQAETQRLVERSAYIGRALPLSASSVG